LFVHLSHDAIPLLPRCTLTTTGSGTVTEEFLKKGWNGISIDNHAGANNTATIRADILTMNVNDLPCVPDFIWASPPCLTYSNLGGKTHRDLKNGNWAVSKQARQHDLFFAKMAEIIEWALEKHPHLIVAIENPLGRLHLMPLMESLKNRIQLGEAKVDYCAFGRDDKKPTMIWSNNGSLIAGLSRFTCKKSDCDGIHLSVRGNCGKYDFGAIPENLAMFVAEQVNATLVNQAIRFRKYGHCGCDNCRL
jgi:hypothetical protein